MYSSSGEIPSRPQRAQQALQILRDVLYLDPAQRAHLAGADYANRVLKSARWFLCFDFLDQDYDKPLRILASKHDVIAIQVLDARNLSCPGRHPSLVDRNGQTLYLNSSMRGRARHTAVKCNNSRKSCWIISGNSGWIICCSDPQIRMWTPCAVL